MLADPVEAKQLETKEFDVDLHKATQNKCRMCHSSEVIESKIDAVKSKLEQCQGCHNVGFIEKNLAKQGFANQGYMNQGNMNQGNMNQEFAELHTVSATQEKKKKNIPNATALGMRYPMYYEGTRLGDKPNEMASIPAGEFIMGTDNRLPDEGPQHKIKLPAYYIDIYEVTNLQYKKFNDATHRRSPTHFRNRTFPARKADHPVTYVSWQDAHAYCQWAGKRLPTDQEWEKAARGTDGKMYPWGETFAVKNANTPLRWKQLGDFGDTTPVGSFDQGVSIYGLHDMSGNVWEWTDSWYTAYPNNSVFSESYGTRYKTLKGGSWFDCSFYKCGISAPVFNRAFFAKRTKNDSFGFRCARNAK